ncbi:polyprenyl synthetase [Mycobacterium sp. 1164966.3]|uniref:hydroxysqualene dehydroxylase n=1 Tax=Mycobacterium sp. 1164966.3 TaxID=1856861 RepID=UPI0008010A4B|nr:FAD-dependent oxidoreductase [Mycobacterium sp. 1164966.3]OBA82117.1 polyprenyl synthetase [Mycobacterium sp. 1164966.3]
MKTVAVLGGGVGGLSAAHELAERGFKVKVYEHRDVFGGKARSMPVPGSGKAGRADLPAEHGFRFFPGFYQHLYDTMRRIPDGQGTVHDHLDTPKLMMIAQAEGRNEIIGPMLPPASLDDLKLTANFIWTIGTQIGIPAHEMVAFFEQMLTYLTSCQERRIGQWERMSWMDFVDAEHRSAAFKKFIATGMTRTLVAARAEEMSARTGASILWQLMFCTSIPGKHADGVLTGPTSEMWIDPWVSYLRSRDVELHVRHSIEEIHCDGRRITGVTVRKGAHREKVKADYYVSAMPLERLRLLLTDKLIEAEPRLRPVKDKKLQIRWMNGMMFYLHEDVPLVNGHILFIDSAWALTAISQKQFWHGIDFSGLGNGRVGGILSVDISDWCTPGTHNKKPARECSRAEIHDEVWAQIRDHIDKGVLKKKNVVTWFLDPDIQMPNPGKATNAEPLLVNTAGSWANRPDAVTKIPNFFLASDFVQTNTDLATMEGANEAARRAVNGILKAANSHAKPCGVWPLWEPPVLAPFRMLDAVRWRLGLDVKLPVKATPSGRLQPTDLAARTLLALAHHGRPAFALLDRYCRA